MLAKYASRDPVPDETRIASRRELGHFTLGVLGKAWEANDLKPHQNQKVTEAVVLQLLLRSPALMETCGLPASPFAHYFKGVDPNSRTTAFQLYGVKSNELVPTHVTAFHPPSMEVPSRQYKGVLLVSLGDLLMSSVEKRSPIISESKRHDSLTHGQGWMISYAARKLVAEVTEGVPPLDSVDKGWLDESTKNLAGEIKSFDPTRPSVLPPLDVLWYMRARHRNVPN